MQAGTFINRHMPGIHIRGRMTRSIIICVQDPYALGLAFKVHHIAISQHFISVTYNSWLVKGFMQLFMHKVYSALLSQSSESHTLSELKSDESSSSHSRSHCVYCRVE